MHPETKKLTQKNMPYLTLQEAAHALWCSADISRNRPGQMSRRKCTGNVFLEECPGRNIRIRIQDYKSPRVAVMICASPG